MPGAMQMSFVNAGGLSGTKLFTNAVNPTKITWAATAECLRETKCNISTPAWQVPIIKLVPMFLKKSC